jgi:hypothetical protein
MRLLFAIALVVLVLWAGVTWAGTMRCTTSEDKTLGRLHTVCDDGTRVTHRWNTALGRWETTATTKPNSSCTGQMNRRTQQVEGRCR